MVALIIKDIFSPFYKYEIFAITMEKLEQQLHEIFTQNL